MKAITVRNIPPDVAKAIKEKAKKEHLSLNRAVVELLEETTVPAKSPRKRVLHHDLDFLAGVWTKEEADEFDSFLKEQRSFLDPKDWK